MNNVLFYDFISEFYMVRLDRRAPIKKGAPPRQRALKP
jgi:hypothetical protein